MTSILDPDNVSDDVIALNPELFGGSPMATEQPSGSSPSHLEVSFAKLWDTINGPPLEPEHKFDANRKWRFDFAHVESKVAIELEGGIWMKGKQRGRHNSPKGFIADCEKYNTAALQGWAVIRLPSPAITKAWAVKILALIIQRSSNNGNDEDSGQHL